MGTSSMVQPPQVFFSPLESGLAVVTVLATAGGAMISVPPLLSDAIRAGSMWSPWMSVSKLRSACGRPVKTAGLAGSTTMTLPPASITREAWYTGVILIGPADDLKVCAGRSVWARAETANKATAAQAITARIDFIYTLLLFIPPSNVRNLSTHGVARQSKRAASGGSAGKKRVLSVPESAGRRVLCNVVLVDGTC